MPSRLSTPLLFAALALVGCTKPTAPPAAPPPASDAGAAQAAPPRPAEPVVVQWPADVGAPAWLKGRAEAQRATRDALGVRADFSFSDKRAESKITFQGHVVDDAARDYKAVHYDHGSAIATADVDGDGWLDVYLVDQLGPSELWRNKGDGTFENITATSGLALADAIKVGASFADFDNDGDADVFLSTVRGGNYLFANDGKGHFEDVTLKAGVGPRGHSSAAVFFDYDRDGKLDLYVTNVGVYTHADTRGRGGYWVGLTDAFSGHNFPERNDSNVLYRNLGDGRFEDVTAKVGLTDKAWSGDAAAFDANGDGFLDLYVLNMQGSDLYFENQGGKKFVDKSDKVFPATPWGSMGVSVIDYDRDGKLDLYITDMHTDMAMDVPPDREKDKIPADKMFHHGFLGDARKLVLGNAMFHNKGGGKFEETSQATGVENYWPWGPSMGDVNADGYEDLFVASSMNYPFRYGINSLLLNQKGKAFADAEFILGIEPRAATSKPWFELDCAQPQSPRTVDIAFECGARKDKVSVWASKGSRAAVIADFDGDGDLDIITNEFNDVPQVLISDLAQKPIHWLKVQLVGTTSNRDGLGALVTVKAHGAASLRLNDGRTGYLSQSRLPLYFGLGDAEKVDAIEVRWPSGKTQTVKGPIASNALVTVEEKK